MEKNVLREINQNLAVTHTWIVPESSLKVKKASFPKVLRATILPATETLSPS